MRDEIYLNMSISPLTHLTPVALRMSPVQETLPRWGSAMDWVHYGPNIFPSSMVVTLHIKTNLFRQDSHPGGGLTIDWIPIIPWGDTNNPSYIITNQFTKNTTPAVGRSDHRARLGDIGVVRGLGTSRHWWRNN